MNNRVYNFSAGPAMLPTQVLAQAQREMLDWQGSGMSVMEISHRSDAFMQLAKQTIDDLRELMTIPNNYQILFLQGGAATQFATVPMNLLNENNKADYAQTGIWSEKAIKEARRYGDINVAVESQIENGLSCIPDQDTWSAREDAAYFHYTPNETINGVAFTEIPDMGDIPVVADLSSAILSAPFEVSRCGLIYAGAQKNMGPAGITIVIVRDDLIKGPMRTTPSTYSYQIQAKNESMYNTPPTYSWYIVSLVLQWMKEQGGLNAIAAMNRNKATKLYRFIDENPFYQNPVKPAFRSIMNVPFTLANEACNAAFLDESTAAGLTNLKGHRDIGGMRASIYNAMPEAGIDKLLEFMQDFAKRNQ